MYQSGPLCQARCFVPTRYRRRLKSFISDRVGHEASFKNGCLVLGGSALILQGLESLDQIAEKYGFTFEDAKKYDIDFLKPIDATEGAFNAWKEKRRKDRAADRLSKHRAKRRAENIKEAHARNEAEARSAAEAKRQALADFESLSVRDREVLLMALNQSGITTPEIMERARKLAAFTRRVRPPLYYGVIPATSIVKGLRKVIHRSLRRLKAKDFLSLFDTGFWRHPMTKAVPTNKALTVAEHLMEQRDTVTCNVLGECHGRTEIIEEIAPAAATSCKKLQQDDERMGGNEVMDSWFEDIESGETVPEIDPGLEVLFRQMDEAQR